MKNTNVIRFSFLFIVLMIGVIGIAGMVHADTPDNSHSNTNLEIKTNINTNLAGASANASVNADLNRTQERDQERNQTMDQNQTHVPEQDRNQTRDRLELQSEDHYYFMQNGTAYQLRLRTMLNTQTGENESEMQMNGYNVSTRLRLNVSNAGNASQIRIHARLENGQQKEVKILPDVASQTAMNIFRNRNMTLVLKQVGNGTNASLAYQANSNQTVRLFGLFRVRAMLQAQINAENGDVTEVQRPWWYFLATQEGGVQASTNTNSTQTNVSENATVNSSNAPMMPVVGGNVSENSTLKA